MTLPTASLGLCPEEPIVFQHTPNLYGSFHDLATCTMVTCPASVLALQAGDV